MTTTVLPHASESVVAPAASTGSLRVDPRGRTKRRFALAVITALVAYGAVRIGVGSALLAQAASLVDFPALEEAVEEVAVFLDQRADRALLPIGAHGYFLYIMAMGALLFAGGIGALLRRRWGYAALGCYLAMHAALFVNFRGANPKLVGLAVSVVLVSGLLRLWPPERRPRSAIA